MKLLMENWRGFLNEKLMLKPGPNGWDLYRDLVAKAYMAAPSFEPRAVSSFEATTPFIEKMFKQIQSRVEVQFVDYHPYETAEELRQDVQQNNLMRVATIDADHALFDEITNAKFRAIHDYMSHIQAFGSTGTPFGLVGELKAYNVHLKTLPPEAAPALFTEIVGQVCAKETTGEFQEQKICLLDGFDYYNVGVVNGYKIVDKELVKEDAE